MMVDLINVLSRGESGSARLDRAVLLRALPPGLDQYEVQSQLRQIELPAAPAVEALCTWRDGTRTRDAMPDDIHFSRASTLS